MRRLHFVIGLMIISMALPCTLNAAKKKKNRRAKKHTAQVSQNESPKEVQVEPVVVQTPPAPIKKLRLAVMDVNLQAKDIDPIVAESISSVLAAELSLRGADRYEVVSRNDLRNLMQQQVEAQLLGCNEPKCLSGVGAAASADHMVTATLGKIEESLVFTLELFDVSRSIVISRQSVSWQGPQSGIVELCRPYVARLLDGPQAKEYQGGLELIVTEEDATVHLNDREPSQSPMAPVGELPIGKHSLQIVKDGYLPYKTDFVVNRNETTLLTVQLIDEDSIKPWYAKWWFWTGTAAVVGGAITAAVLLRDNPSTTADFEMPLPF